MEEGLLDLLLLRIHLDGLQLHLHDRLIKDVQPLRLGSQRHRLDDVDDDLICAVPLFLFRQDEQLLHQRADEVCLGQDLHPGRRIGLDLTVCRYLTFRLAHHQADPDPGHGDLKLLHFEDLRFQKQGREESGSVN